MDRIRRVALSGLLLVALLALPACSPPPAAAPAQDPKALEGVEWGLTASSMSSVDLGAAGITAKFEAQRVAGFSGVNQYGGAYTAGTDGAFKAGPLQATLMAGPEPLMKAEQAYLKLLESCTTYKVEAGKLTLSTSDGTTLEFEAAKPVELPGTKWVVTGYNNGKEAVTSPSLGSTLTLEFGTDGTVSGNSGVNTFSGPFKVEGKKLTIGPLASTKMAGPEELMTQETLYLAALQKATIWGTSKEFLDLRDAEGALQVSAIAP